MNIKNILYKIGIGCTIILVFLWLTNPSYAKFKEFGAEISTTYRKAVYKRTSNYIIFSIYQKQIIVTDRYTELEVEKTENYIGILMNFYKMKD